MTTSGDAKAYLSRREIPQLFESLMTGLMYYRPEDHINYLQDCLNRIKRQGLDQVRWNLFIEQRRSKTPLPPITPENGRRTLPCVPSPEPPITEQKPVENHTQIPASSPLPPIGHSVKPETEQITDLSGREERALSLGCPLVLITGGPGSGKSTIARLLADRYSDWTYVSVTDALRTDILNKGTEDDKQNLLDSVFETGDLPTQMFNVEQIRNLLENNNNSSGILLEGFPRTKQEAVQCRKLVSNIDFIVCIDSSEEECVRRLVARRHDQERIEDNKSAVEARLRFYKENTLPVIKLFDDANKVAVIEGDQDVKEVFYHVTQLLDRRYHSGKSFPPTNFTEELLLPLSPRPPSSPRPNQWRTSSAARKLSSRPNSGFANVPKTIKLDTLDEGRKENMPTCPVIFIMGGPGSGKTTQIQRLMKRYPDFVYLSIEQMVRRQIIQTGSRSQRMEMLRSIMNEGRVSTEALTADHLRESFEECFSAKGIIVEGMPRDAEQLSLFNHVVGGLTLAVLLDCEEVYLGQRLLHRHQTTNRLDDNLTAISSRIRHFKYHGLPLLGHLDDLNKLAVVDGDRSADEIFLELTDLVESLVLGKEDRVPSRYAHIPPRTPVGLYVSTRDNGRSSSLSVSHIISILGGPGTGVNELCKQLCEKFPGLAHLSPTSIEQPEIDDNRLFDMLKEHNERKMIILEGYPANQIQLEQFNRMVGGMSGVVVVDSEESFSRECVPDDQDPDLEIQLYRRTTLPVLSHYEEQDKLTVINWKEDKENLFAEIAQVVGQIAKKSKVC